MIDNYGEILVASTGCLFGDGGVTNEAPGWIDDAGRMGDGSASGLSLTNLGTVTIESSGWLNVSGTLTNGSATNSSGTVIVAGDLEIEGLLDNFGTLCTTAPNGWVQDVGVLTNEQSGQVDNATLLTVQYDGLMTNAGSINNEVSGTIEMEGSAKVDNSGTLTSAGFIDDSATLDNCGTLTIEGSTANDGSLVVEAGAEANVYGTLTIDAGTITVAAAGTFIVEPGGSLSVQPTGAITVNLGGELDNNGGQVFDIGMITNNGVIANNSGTFQIGDGAYNGGYLGSLVDNALLNFDFDKSISSYCNSDEGTYWYITSSSGGMNDVSGESVTINGVLFIGTTANTVIYIGGLAGASNAPGWAYPAINVSKTDANGNPTSYYVGETLEIQGPGGQAGTIVISSITDEGSYWYVTSSSGGMNDISGESVAINGVPFVGTTANTVITAGGLSGASN